MFANSKVVAQVTAKIVRRFKHDSTVFGKLSMHLNSQDIGLDVCRVIFQCSLIAKL